MAPRGQKRKREPTPVTVDGDDEQHADPGEAVSVEADGDGDGEQNKEQEMWDAFKEEHHEAIEQLPLSLHRTFTLIRDLDVQSQALQEELPSLLHRYIQRRRQLQATSSSSDTSQQPPVPASIDHSSREIVTRLAVVVEDWARVSDEKLNLATSAYNSTDRYVRILDMDIAEQEKDSPLGRDQHLSQGDLSSPLSTEGFGNGVRQTRRSQKGRKSTRRATGRDGRHPQPNPTPVLTSNDTSPNRPPNAINMAVLPNEPVYCYCNQVSHGLMIACDNQSCFREWFHYQCVGLREEPKGGKPWYCPDCATALNLKRDVRRRKR